MVDSMSGPDDVERVELLLGWVGRFKKDNAAEIFEEFFGVDSPRADVALTPAAARTRLCHAQLLLRAFAFAREAQVSTLAMSQSLICYMP
jgi:hypothetical protein